MERIPVESSNVESVGYDKSLMVLQIEFKGGSIYNYFGVGEGVYQALINAQSVGGYLNNNIKGVYPYEKVE